jgi:hypothetical protein
MLFTTHAIFTVCRHIQSIINEEGSFRNVSIPLRRFDNKTQEEIKLNPKNFGAPYKANSNCAEATFLLRRRTSPRRSLVQLSISASYSYHLSLSLLCVVEDRIKSR